MIHVSRPRKPPQQFLDAARREMREVVPLFRRSNGRTPKVTFKAYRTPALVECLQKLFHQKCAYCEAPYAATGYVEVEHYRPKSLYYWLAAEWSNLLPACKRCNNGKLSKFPLVDPNKRARKSGEEKREDPLLLNPCDAAAPRWPERHLAFDLEDGSIRAVAAHGRPSPRGETSIKIYRLARKELSDSRKSWVIRVKLQVALCKRGQTAADRELAAQGLTDLLQPTQPFRSLTVAILRKNGIRLR